MKTIQNARFAEHTRYLSLTSDRIRHSRMVAGIEEGAHHE